MKNRNPCKGCRYDNNGSCSKYKTCQAWRDSYMNCQDQINAYARKVLPAYLAQKRREAAQGNG